VASTFSGKVWIFGDDINTDLVIPGYALFMPPDERKRQCFSANRPGWVDEVQPGDVLIGGRNFGVGSARPIGEVFVDLGIVGILAESFNGLGLRNCVNVGLPVLPCPGVTEAFREGDVAAVDWHSGRVENVTKGTTVDGRPVPDTLRNIVEAGGVEEMLRREGYLLAPST
jgi:3-isopropylmalate/(R)-2-methylmalate dehydratase small subunit